MLKLLKALRNKQDMNTVNSGDQIETKPQVKQDETYIVELRVTLKQNHLSMVYDLQRQFDLINVEHSARVVTQKEYALIQIEDDKTEQILNVVRDIQKICQQDMDLIEKARNEIDNKPLE